MPKLPPDTDLLCAYVEPFATDRRVVVVGDHDPAFAEHLLELGARSVHAYETVATSARDGSFELAIVPDAARLASPDTVFARLRRLIGDEGIVVAGAAAESDESRNASSLGYYELYDLVALQWGTVVMVGQVPFSGAALAVLGEEGDPEVTVDTQLAGDAEPPTHFFAIASETPFDVRPYVILQLPAGETIEPAPAPAPPPRSSSHDAAHERAELAQARLRVEVLEAQLDEQRRRATEASEVLRRFEQAHVRDEQLGAEVDRLRAELDRARREVERIRIESSTQLVARSAEAEEAIERARELEALAVKAEQTSMVASALESELIELGEAHVSEIAALEEALRERGRAIHALERELVRRERIVQELLLSIEHGPDAHATQSPSPATSADEASIEDLERLLDERAQLHVTLESLAQDAARREGELRAARWRIEELELGRSEGDASKTGTGELPGAEPTDEREGRLQDEIDMLRQALRQEHEARTRAESGEELARARAEIQRQAALLAQLRGESTESPSPG